MKALIERLVASSNAYVAEEHVLFSVPSMQDYGKLARRSLDEMMAGRTEPQLQRMQTRYRTLTGELLTLREVAQRHGQSVGLLQMVGTPSQVADQMEDYFDQVGGDGFMLSPIYSPGAIEEFVDLVVPELQRRSRYRRDYTGTTQRDHLMQEE